MSKYLIKELSEQQQLNAIELSKVYNINLTVAKLLSQRGVVANEFNDYVNKAELYNPFEMENMQQACDLITEVINNDGRILVFGDYDADGISASSVLKLFFNDNGIDCDVLLPNRDDGYGLNVSKITQSFNTKKFDLLITVDCGISNKIEVNDIVKLLNIPVIVTDHHELPSELPNCICVNPKMGNYPFKYLSGSGVALKLVQALSDEDTAREYAFIACIGTIADVMPLVDENRSIVKLGLSNVNNLTVVALLNQLKVTEPTVADISMKLAPRINSAGRIGSPNIALEFLLSNDEVNIKSISALNNANITRQRYLEETVKTAEEIIITNGKPSNCVVVYSDDFHNGVMGIAASKLKDKYNQVAVVLSSDVDDNLLVGSARSTSSINLFNTFSEMKDLLVKFGGHSVSVGFTISKSNLSIFTQRLNELCEYGSGQEKISYFDCCFEEIFLSLQMFEQFKLLQPCSLSDEVIFYYKGSCTQFSKFGAQRNNIRIVINDVLELKSFNSFLEFEIPLSAGGEVEVLFTLEYDAYSKKINGKIIDMAFTHSIKYDEMYASNVLKQAFEQVDYITDDELSKHIEGQCLLIFSCFEDYLQLSKAYDLSNYTVDYFCSKTISERQIIISPINVVHCNNMIISFIDETTGIGFVGDEYLYYACNSILSYLIDVKVDRNCCVMAYKALISSKEGFISQQYEKLKKTGLTLNQFLLALRVFEQLGLVEIDNNMFYLLEADKVNLDDSILYKQVSIK